MKRWTGLTAAILASVLLAPFSVASESEADRISCAMKDSAACTRLIDNESESAAVRWIAHSNRATIFNERGEEDRARLDFREAARLDPANRGVGLDHRCFAIAAGLSQGMPVYGSAVAYRRAEAQKAALSRCEVKRFGTSACTLVKSECDQFADLPASIVPDDRKQCSLGALAEISGTLLDIKRQAGGWIAGTKIYVDTCTGLVDPSTGFSVLFGSTLPPDNCTIGTKFVASGSVASGFEPKFFLRVRSITCER